MSAIESRYRFRLTANAEEFLHWNHRNDPISTSADILANASSASFTTHSQRQLATVAVVAKQPPC
jgi:hypothetical protein